MRPNTWFDGIQFCEQTAKGYVLVTVISAAGSTPRSAGTKMVVVDDEIYDTIGGGHLEHQAIAKARSLLAKSEQVQHIEHYPLASKLGQCCGGAVNLLFEVMTEHQKQLVIFGAGHVSKSLLPILAQLPLHISWVDSRKDMFDSHPENNNVQKIVSDDPVEYLNHLPDSSMVLIMTHNHQLDFGLVEAVLKADRFDYCGMIGSDTKSRRFRTRLSHKGFTQAQVDKLICPVGVIEINGKRPIEVAVSIAGQIIQRINQQAEKSHKPSLKESWLKTKQISEML